MRPIHALYMDNEATRVVGYIRVSTDDQNLGPDAQRAALQTWCDGNGAILVAVYEDHGLSGAAPLDKRPGLLTALDALPDHSATILLVAKRDRLARDVVVAAMVERLAERQGARVFTADGTANLEGPEGMLMRGIVDLFAQYERAIIRTRTRAALLVKRERGEYTGGDTPYGFKLSEDGGRLVPVSQEQDVLKAAQTLREQGLSLRAVATELQEMGYVNRRGRRFDPRQVSRMLAAA